MSASPVAQALRAERLARLDPPQNVRDTCYDCFRPREHCYCQLITRVYNRTEIIILQHPRERFHPIGTARIAKLALNRVRVEVDHDRCFSAGRTPLDLSPGTGLLYPSADALDLCNLSPAERPERLVVIDGTWHHAHTLFRDIEALAHLPRYKFRPPAPSQYRLRREPCRDFVSTIEAIVHCLRELEPDTAGVLELVDVFTAMIDRQIAARDQGQRGRSLARRRARPCRVLPRALAEDFARVVVVYGEAPVGHLVHWTAQRLSSGEVFERVLRPSEPIEANRLHHMGLSAEEVDRGADLESFLREWGAFAHDDDVLVAWNPTTLAPFARLVGGDIRSVFLKSAYGNLRRRSGPLEDVVHNEGLPIEPTTCRGRAAERLSNAVALARYLNRLAQPPSGPEWQLLNSHDETSS
jgi:hypothetical protein